MDKENLSPELAFLKNIFRKDRWENYIRRINALSSSSTEEWETIDFPVEIALELTNHCNLRCVMCPVPDLNRKRGFMDEPVFRRIIGDISKESGFLLLPQGFGELLLHKKWPELIEFASGKGIQPIIILTNGMLLNKTNIQGLLNTVNAVVVTIDGTTAKTYESIRVKGRFKTVTENIQRFLEIRGHNENPRLVLRIIKMKETEGEIEDFRKHWAKKIGKGDIIQISDCIDWAGNVVYRGINENQPKEKRHPCKMLWKNLSVFYNGEVSPCCYDAEGELIIGSALNQSLKEMWNGLRLKDLRTLHLTHQFKKIPLCSRCRNWL